MQSTLNAVGETSTFRYKYRTKLKGHSERADLCQGQIPYLAMFTTFRTLIYQQTAMMKALKTATPTGSPQRFTLLALSTLLQLLMLLALLAAAISAQPPPYWELCAGNPGQDFECPI